MNPITVWSELNDWVVVFCGVPLWLITLAAMLLAFVVRFFSALAAEGGRHDRNKSLLERCAADVGEAHAANENLRRQIENARAEAQAEAMARRTPIGAVEAAYGIGSGTVDSLKYAGIQFLGDLLDRDPLDATGVGPERAGILFRFLDQALGVATEAYALRSPDYEVDPEIEAIFADAQNEISARQEQLSVDDEAIPAVLARLEADGSAFEPRSPAEQLRFMARAPLRWVREPGRFVSSTVLLVANLAVVGALPWVAYQWGFLEAGSAWLVAAACVWLAAMVFGMAYFLFPFSTGMGNRPPDAGSFAEQRLQLIAYRMALELGIDPPLVAIVDSDKINAYASGSARGPSIVVLYTGLLKRMTDAEVQAIIAHELGHLRGDHVRLRRALHWVSAPLDTAGRIVSAVFAEATFWSMAKWYSYRGRWWWTYNWGFHSLILLPVAAIAGVAMSVIAAFRAAFGALNMAASRQDEYDADAAAAEAAGIEAMAAALSRLGSDHDVGPPSALALVMMQLENARDETDVPGKRMVRRVEALLELISETHPPTPVRIAALRNQGRRVVDWASALMRSSVAIGAAGAVALLPPLAVDRLWDQRPEPPPIVHRGLDHTPAAVVAPPPPPTSATDCGNANAHPRALEIANWSSYTCTSRAAAGSRWSSCLRRVRYSNASGSGCPDGERCCPP